LAARRPSAASRSSWVGGIASLFFSREVTEDDLQRLAAAFPSGRASQPKSLLQIKGALEGPREFAMNEIRFVAEDSSLSEGHRAQLTRADLGVVRKELKVVAQPIRKNVLQLIARAAGHGSRRRWRGHCQWRLGQFPAEQVAEARNRRHRLKLGGSGSGSEVPSRYAAVPPAARRLRWIRRAFRASAKKDLVNVLKALTRIGSQMHGEAAGVGTATAVTQEISNLPANNRDLFHRPGAAGLAPREMLCVPIAPCFEFGRASGDSLALDRNERGEVKVNAVPPNARAMNKRIDGAVRSSN